MQPPHGPYPPGPQYPPGPPGYGPGGYGTPPPAPRKSNTLVIVLGIVGVVLMCGISGIVCLAAIGWDEAEDETEDETDKSPDPSAAAHGPCGHLEVDSAKAAFDETKFAECGACCKKRAPENNGYFFFENNAPPGRCRCLGGDGTSEAGGDCSKAKGLPECMSCCTSAGKKKSTYDKSKGCSCE